MNESLLAQLKEGIELLLDVAGNQFQHAADENDTQFSLEIQLEATLLHQILTRLAPYADLFNITLEYQIQEGRGSADLVSTGKLVIVGWSEDETLSPPDLVDPQAMETFADLRQQLASIGTKIRPDSLTRDLDLLIQAEADVDLSLYVTLDKSAVVGVLGWPRHVRILLYFSADKFLQRLNSREFWNLGELLISDTEEILILLLGNASGVAVGPNIRVFGRDYWVSPDLLGFQANDADCQKVSAALNFRNEESNWEIVTSKVTPYHLYIERTGFERNDMLETIARFRDRLAVAYLADHVKVDDGRLTCQFRGHKRVWIPLPPLNEGDAAIPIYKLFTWAYENTSSDKLEIMRQIISLQLEHNTTDNYTILRERAADMLGAAKSNFQIYLRRSVEMYFDKRLKVSEFIQKFSEETGASVSALTSELINNLYKTVGLILAVIIAALVDPKQTPPVVYWTSLLYLIYIGFIFSYLLPAAYFRFSNKVQEYRHGIVELHDVLSNEEILRLQGNSFRRARWLFLIYFTVTNILYALLGLAAFLLMQFFGGWL
jgi:hypothetical protein